MKLPCPRCYHEETQPMPAALNDALTRLPRQKASHPFDIIHDLFGIGPESSQRRRQPERIFFRKVAPPQRIPYLPILGCWYLTMLAVTLVPTDGGGVASSLIMLGAGLTVHRAYRFNRQDWPRLLERWERSLICLRCGNVFAPEGA